MPTMRFDKPSIELVIRAKDGISHEQMRAITLAANLGASVSLYLEELPEGNLKKIALHRADYVEVKCEVLKDRSGQYQEFTKKQITN